MYSSGKIKVEDLSYCRSLPAHRNHPPSLGRHPRVRQLAATPVTLSPAGVAMHEEHGNESNEDPLTLGHDRPPREGHLVDFSFPKRTGARRCMRNSGLTD